MSKTDIEISQKADFKTFPSTSIISYFVQKFTSYADDDAVMVILEYSKNRKKPYYWGKDHINFKENADYYFTPNLRSRFTGKGQGTKDDVKYLTSFFADIDTGKTGHLNLSNVKFKTNEEALKDLKKKIPLKPSMIVDSGHGLHVYWLFNEPIEATEKIKGQYEAMQKTLQCDLLEADKTHDCSRILRVAGTWNVKADPVPCEIMEENENRYELEDFDFLETETVTENITDPVRNPVEVDPEELKIIDFDITKYNVSDRALSLLESWHDPKIKDRSDKSRSASYHVLVDSLVSSGLKKNEIYSLISNADHINKWHLEKGKKTKKLQDDVFNRSYSKAVTFVNSQKRSKANGKIDASGWVFDDYVAFLKEHGFTFRMNELLDSLEVNGQKLTNDKAADFFVLMDDVLSKKRGREGIRDIIRKEASKNAYHPIKEYFNNLNLNGVSGTIDKLLTYFKTNDDAMFRVYLKKWLVNAVARAFEAVENPMLVLDGAQGCGKSFFTKWLCPIEKFFIEESINTNDKDCLLRLIRSFVWEVSELGATTRKSDREALKQFLTKKFVIVRKNYEVEDIEKPPMANFIGTINNEAGFLNDPTGSRRFHVVTLEEINWNYSKDIKIDDVWADAYRLYKSGYKFTLTKEENLKRIKLNAEYTATVFTEALLDEVLEVTGNDADYVHVLDFAQQLKRYGVQEKHNEVLAKIKMWAKANGITEKRPRIGDQRPRVLIGVRNNLMAGLDLDNYK